MNLGMALREKGDLEEALRAPAPRRRRRSGERGVQYELGQTLRQSGDLAGAIAAFEKALAIDPELREGYYGLGTALKQQGAAAAEAACAADAERRRRSLQARAEPRRRAATWTHARSCGSTEALRLDDATPRRTTSSASSSGSRAISLRRSTHLEQAVALRARIRRRALQPRRRAVVQRRQGKAVDELRESARLDPAAGAAHAFLGTGAARERATSRARARACSARSRCCRRRPRSMSISGSRICARGELDRRSGSSRPA